MIKQISLVGYLKKFGELSENDIQILTEHTKEVKFKMGDFFVQAGKVTNQVGFILSGVFRYFFYDKRGNEITSLFMAENEFVTNISSFNEFIPSSGYIAAETDCLVILIPRETWVYFSTNIPNWNSILQAVTSKVLLEKTIFQRKLIYQDAKTSYLDFLKKYPTIIQRVPLAHIASFLGITKFSLSRIRNQIAHQ